MFELLLLTTTHAAEAEFRTLDTSLGGAIPSALKDNAGVRKAVVEFYSLVKKDGAENPALKATAKELDETKARLQEKLDELDVKLAELDAEKKKSAKLEKDIAAAGPAVVDPMKYVERSSFESKIKEARKWKDKWEALDTEKTAVDGKVSSLTTDKTTAETARDAAEAKATVLRVAVKSLRTQLNASDYGSLLVGQHFSDIEEPVRNSITTDIFAPLLAVLQGNETNVQALRTAVQNFTKLDPGASDKAALENALDAFDVYRKTIKQRFTLSPGSVGAVKVADEAGVVGDFGVKGADQKALLVALLGKPGDKFDDFKASKAELTNPEFLAVLKIADAGDPAIEAKKVGTEELKKILLKYPAIALGGTDIRKAILDTEKDIEVKAAQALVDLISPKKEDGNTAKSPSELQTELESIAAKYANIASTDLKLDAVNAKLETERGEKLTEELKESKFQDSSITSMAAEENPNAFLSIIETLETDCAGAKELSKEVGKLANSYLDVLVKDIATDVKAAKDVSSAKAEESVKEFAAKVKAIQSRLPLGTNLGTIVIGKAKDKADITVNDLIS